jgi:hypothetical protein
MAFTDCLVVARVSALSFIFLFIFGHRSNVEKTSKNKKREDRKKSSKQGGDGDEEGNMRLIRIAGKEKKERGNQSSIGHGERKGSFFQDTGQSFLAYLSLLSSFLCRKKEKTERE